MTGPRLTEGKELEQKLFDADFYSDLHEEGRYTSMTTVDKADVQRAALLQGQPHPQERRGGFRFLRRRDRPEGGRSRHARIADGTDGRHAGPLGLQEIRRPAACRRRMKQSAMGVQQVITLTDDRVRQGRALGVRTAGADQGADQVKTCSLRRRPVVALRDRPAVRAGAAGPWRHSTPRGRIIRDSHFDQSMNGVNWDGVRAELRPRAAAARSAGELRDVVRDMLGRLGQSHFALIPSSPDSPRDASRPLPISSADPGFDVRLVGGELIVTQVERAAAAAVRPGWRIVAIEGGRQPIDCARFATSTARTRGGRRRRAQRPPAECRGVADRADAAARPARVDGRRHLRGRPGRRRSERAVPRRPSRGSRSPSAACRRCSSGSRRAEATTPGGGTAGVIRFNVWMAAVDREFQRAIDRFRAADGIVIDLRGNPGGLAGMIMGISGHFVGERMTLGVMKTREQASRCGSSRTRGSSTREGERVAALRGAGRDSGRLRSAAARPSASRAACSRSAAPASSARRRWGRRCRRCSTSCRTETC